MFTLGDVADILDDALDMGINIVDALHKLADAGDKGKVTKDNCRNQLGLSGDGSGLTQTDAQVISTTDTHARESFHGCQSVDVIDNSKGNSSAKIVTGHGMNYQEPYGKFHPDSSSGVEDLSGYSKSDSFSYANEQKESPLKLSSYKISAQSPESPSLTRKQYDGNLESFQEDEYYDTPSNDYKSKKWSTMLALNLESDELEPMLVRDFLESPVKKPSVGSAESSDYENESLTDYHKPKRKRRNTYSIESTPVSEAEEKGLPIIDALDDLCRMADCFINENWDDIGKKEHEKEHNNKVGHEEIFGYYSEEEEISPTASRLIDEKIFALDRETAKALESFHVASGGGNEFNEELLQEDKKLSSRFLDTSIHDVVDENIAYIGDQAKLVLRSFEALKSLKQYKNLGSFVRHGDHTELKSDFYNHNEPDGSAFSMSNTDVQSVRKESDYNTQSVKLRTSQRPVADIGRNDTDFSIPDLASNKEHSDIQCKSSDLTSEVNRIDKVGDKLAAAYVEESFPCEFRTVKDVLYEYSDDINTFTIGNKEYGKEFSSPSSTCVKRPGTYVIEGSKDKVFASHISDSPDMTDAKVCSKNQVEKEIKIRDLVSAPTNKKQRAANTSAKSASPNQSVDMGSETTIDSFSVPRSKFLVNKSEVENEQKSNKECQIAKLKYPGDWVKWQTVEDVIGEGSKNRTSFYSNNENFSRHDPVGDHCRKHISDTNDADSLPVRRRPGTYTLDQIQIQLSSENSSDVTQNMPKSFEQEKLPECENKDTINVEILLDDSKGMTKKSNDSPVKVQPKFKRPGTYVLHRVDDEDLQQPTDSLAIVTETERENCGPMYEKDYVYKQQKLNESGYVNSKQVKNIQNKEDFTLENKKGSFVDRKGGDDWVCDDSFMFDKHEGTVVRGGIKRPNTFVLEHADEKVIEKCDALSDFDKNAGADIVDNDLSDDSSKTGSNGSGKKAKRPGTFVLEKVDTKRTKEQGWLSSENRNILAPNTEDNRIGTAYSSSQTGAKMKRPGTFVLEIAEKKGANEFGSVSDEKGKRVEASIEDDSVVSYDACGSTVTEMKRPRTFVLEQSANKGAKEGAISSSKLDGEEIKEDDDNYDGDRPSFAKTEGIGKRKRIPRPNTFVLEKSPHSSATDPKIEKSDVRNQNEVEMSLDSSQEVSSKQSEDLRRRKRPGTFIIEKQMPLSNITNSAIYNDGDREDSEVISTGVEGIGDWLVENDSNKDGIGNEGKPIEIGRVDIRARTQNDKNTESHQHIKSKKSRPSTYTIENDKTANKTDESISYNIPIGFQAVEIELFDENQFDPAEEMNTMVATEANTMEPIDDKTVISDNITEKTSNQNSAADEQSVRDTELSADTIDYETTKAFHTAQNKRSVASNTHQDESRETLEIIERPLHMNWIVSQKKLDPMNKPAATSLDVGEKCTDCVDQSSEVRDEVSDKEEEDVMIKSSPAVVGDSGITATSSLVDSEGTTQYIGPYDQGSIDGTETRETEFGTNISNNGYENKEIFLEKEIYRSEEGDGKGVIERVSVANFSEEERKEQINDDSVPKDKDNAENSISKGAFYNKEHRSRLPDPDLFKEPSDYNDGTDSSIKFSLTSTVETKEDAELNNNEVKTVERDFSYKPDYIEMADEHAVLSIYAESDCCPDENHHNGTAVFNFSKKPVEDRVHELNADESKEAVGQGGSHKRAYNSLETLVDGSLVERSPSALVRLPEEETYSNHGSKNNQIASIKYRDNSFTEIADASRPSCDVNYNDLNEFSDDGKDEQGTECIVSSSSVAETDEDMARGRIALKLEINISDLNDNFNDGITTSERDFHRKENQKSCQSKTKNKSEDLHSTANRKSERIKPPVDANASKIVDNSENVQLTLKINNGKERAGPDVDYSSQGIKFDVNFEDDSKKTATLPHDLRRRLSVKTRRKVKERQGTYVLNSPIFSRDEYEDEAAFKKSLARRSLGSSEDCNLQEEIRRAIEEGRLELEKGYEERSSFEENSNTYCAAANLQDRNTAQDADNSYKSEYLENSIKNVKTRGTSFQANKSPRPGTYVLESRGVENVSRQPRLVIDGESSTLNKDASDSKIQTTKVNETINSDRREKPVKAEVHVSKRESLEKFRKSFETQRIGFFVDISQDKKDENGAEFDVEKEQVETNNGKEYSRSKVFANSKIDSCGVEGSADSKAKVLHETFDRDLIWDDVNEPQSQHFISPDDHGEKYCNEIGLSKFQMKKNTEMVKKIDDIWKNGTDCSEEDKEINSKVNIWISKSMKDQSSAIMMVNNSSSVLDGKMFSDTTEHSGVRETKGIQDGSENHGMDGSPLLPGENLKEKEMVSTKDQGEDRIGVAANEARHDDCDLVFVSDMTNEETGFENGFSRRQKLAQGVEDLNKARYKSWEITPDAEKEVLHRISSLSEQEMRKAAPPLDQFNKDTGSMLERQSSENSGLQSSRYIEEVALAKAKVTSDMLSVQPNETGLETIGSTAEPFKRKSEFFVVDCESFGADVGASEEDVGKRKKNSPRKGEFFVVGEEFDASKIARRKSGEHKTVTQPELGKEASKTGVRRKETFVVRKSTDFDKEKDTKFDESSGFPEKSNEDDLEESKVGSQDKQKAHFEDKSNEDSALISSIEKAATVSSERKYEMDRDIRQGQDETVAEDFDLYVSNGSRPSSGISESQSSLVEDVERKFVRGESVLSDFEESEMCRDQFEKTAAEALVDKKPFDRQLSDSVITVSNRNATRDESVDVVMNLAGNYQNNRLIERQVSENSRLSNTAMKESMAVNTASASMPSLDSDLTMNPFKLPRAQRTQNLGHRPMSYDIKRKPLLEKLEKLCTFMTKSLTKLNTMSEDESEIVIRVDKRHGKEDMYLQRRLSQETSKYHADYANGSHKHKQCLEERDEEASRSDDDDPSVLHEHDEHNEEEIYQSGKEKQLRPWVAGGARITEDDMDHHSLSVDSRQELNSVHETRSGNRHSKDAGHSLDLNRKNTRKPRYKRAAKDDRGNESQRESLAPRLAVLKMQLEEKRRHIEEEKRKMMHQWNEERTKLGQQAFWLAVGKESNLEQERREQEKQAALDAEKKKKPGLIFFPFSDENDPAKALNNQKAKRNILESPPNECSTPLTPIPSQDPGNHTQPSTTSDYPVRENRIGSATIMEASTIGEQSAAFSLPKRTSYEALEAENQSGELQDQVFVSPRVQYQSKEQNAYTSDSRHHVAMPQSGKEPHQSSRLDDRGFEDASTNNTGRRTAWTDPYLVKPDDFPPYQKSVDERLDTRPGYSPRSEYINTDEVIRKNSYEEPDDITRQYVESQARAHYEPPPDIEGHAAAGSLRKESPRETAMFALQNEDAISEEGTPKEKGIAMVIPGDDISAAGPSCKTIIEITDDIESTQTTLTPEQQKKKEKFIQNRLKRQQEEKAKREAEQERKRRKEEKIKERKAQLEKKEIEEQERLRKQKQEEETLRGKLRDPEEVECAPFRIPRRDEQWGTPPGKKQGTPSGISRSPLLGQVEDNPPQQSSFAEYKGPPVYVKPTGKSNRQIIVNAISYCCLSGEVNKEAKEKSLQVLSQSNATHFFVLFRDGLKFRGLYTYVQEVDEAHKIYGVGPKVIVNKMIDRLFKYSSGAKSFTQIPAKSLSIQVDGIQINKECWSQGKGTKLPSKTDSNLRKGAATSSKSDLLKKGSPKPVRR
ncbi:uncharacterized protein LOC135690133 [Rhopilema esculentum]|uniref:uncharacterized protein LOC135690133 n=1 Tax=Rhopilema esculentum TaxID=499914 RepID=UPI0031DA07EC|eukprot:gene8198-14132_t